MTLVLETLSNSFFPGRLILSDIRQSRRMGHFKILSLFSYIFVSNPFQHSVTTLHTVRFFTRRSIFDVSVLQQINLLPRWNVARDTVQRLGEQTSPLIRIQTATATIKSWDGWQTGIISREFVSISSAPFHLHKNYWFMFNEGEGVVRLV